MSNGLSSPDIGVGFAPPRVEAKPPQHFTPLDVDHFANQRYEKPIITEPPKYQEDPTISMSPQDEELTKKLMAQIMDKPGPKKPQEVISQIENKIPQEIKKPQGLWAKISEWFRNLFR